MYLRRRVLWNALIVCSTDLVEKRNLIKVFPLDIREISLYLEAKIPHLLSYTGIVPLVLFLKVFHLPYLLLSSGLRVKQ